jgi:hypothetical protein
MRRMYAQAGSLCHQVFPMRVSQHSLTLLLLLEITILTERSLNVKTAFGGTGFQPVLNFVFHTARDTLRAFPLSQL